MPIIILHRQLEIKVFSEGPLAIASVPDLDKESP